MLLRSITKHVKDQNWFAVFLDFFIVVAGILIAFQITNWNATRDDQAKEKFLIGELVNDFEALDTSVSHGACYQMRALDGLHIIALALKSGELLEKDRARFENGLRFGYFNASTNKNSGALTEMMSSGKFSLLQDAKLRRALTDYAGFIDTSMASRRDLGLSVSSYQRSFTKQFDYDLERFHKRSDQDSPYAFQYSAIGEYDLNAMRADPAFIEAVFELREFQRLYLEWDKNTFKRVQNVQRLLGGTKGTEIKCQ